MMCAHKQAGSFLIEALIGILIFFIGALAMIALQANGIAAQSDAQYRIEAANLVNRIIGQMTIGVNRTSAATLEADLLRYAYNPTTVGTCNYSGGPDLAAPPTLAQWNTDISATLPSASASMRQILVDTTSSNRVTVTVCWQTAADAAPRRHSVIAYIN